MQAILVPTDFSPGSRTAVEIAALLAAQANAELVLLNVDENATHVKTLGEFVPHDELSDTISTNEPYEYLVELRRELVRYPVFTDLKIRAELYPGSLVSVVETYAERHNMDLIVMGTRGAGGLEELLIGSNTEKVIRRACCPVLAVPQEAIPGPIKVIAFPTTLKDDQKVVFRRLAALQQTLGMDISIRLLYINDPAGLGSEEAIEQRYLELVKDSNLQNTIFHLKGALDLDEGIEILQFAKEQQADMITMGTHQRRGLSHLILGSMTEDTVNHSDIPVLTIPIR
ncbi:universal stress protein [Telluribacter sp. SYSU D00476]|uniref:universal stress protein n=1 Tax=Telluribacter sp. SYSU D00476 TaxID=2811430 RepID=UPI001FF5C5AE|nr:universal stress protein [Telluribacter sp. SYSU D00476]